MDSRAGRLVHKLYLSLQGLVAIVGAITLIYFIVFSFVDAYKVNEARKCAYGAIDSNTAKYNIENSDDLQETVINEFAFPWLHSRLEEQCSEHFIISHYRDDNEITTNIRMDFTVGSTWSLRLIEFAVVLIATILVMSLLHIFNLWLRWIFK